MYCNADLQKYLCEEIFPQIATPPYGEIEIYRIGTHKPVFLFYEKARQILAVGKLFKYGHITLDEAWNYADREYHNLRLIRDQFGMNNDSCEIVNPLGEKKELSALLVTRKAQGHLLDHYIVRAIYEQRQQKLLQKLGYLANFFAKLHQNSITSTRISSIQAQEYFLKILNLLRFNFLRASEILSLEKAAAAWWNRKEVWINDTEVIVHGDATPTNFFFHHQKVIGIDLESMRYADRCWDLGFIAAELKHHFIWRGGSKWGAEPFIGHFLWEYALSLGKQEVFYYITRKLPLYMALGLIRMARNQWLSEGYRKMLVEEARLCLE